MCDVTLPGTPRSMATELIVLLAPVRFCLFFLPHVEFSTPYAHQLSSMISAIFFVFMLSAFCPMQSSELCRKRSRISAERAVGFPDLFLKSWHGFSLSAEGPGARNEGY